MTDHVLYFRKHKGQPLPEVPADYLHWALRTVKLSSGIRAAVTAELERRGLTPPPLPAPTGCWKGPCPHCHCRVISYHWHQHSNGVRQVRSTCARCRAFLGIAPRLVP